MKPRPASAKEVGRVTGEEISGTDPRLQLSTKQFRAMLSVVADQRPDEIAIENKVSVRRVRRWLATPIFQRAVHAQRRSPWPRQLTFRAFSFGPRQGLEFWQQSMAKQVREGEADGEG
jgi:hypothetical protein